MKNWLNKECVVKRKVWALLFESVIDTLIFTIILYLCVTNYNTFIIEILNSISNNNLEFTFSILMFSIILIIITMLKLGFYIVCNGNVEINNNKRK